MHTPVSPDSSATGPLKKTPLFQEHLTLGARIVPFAGWQMPVQYTGVVEEHHAVRKNVGLFDISHMGELSVSGRGSLDFLQRMVVSDVSGISLGQAQYSAFCNENGMVIDDVVIAKRGLDSYLLCTNASNTDKDFSWLKEHLPRQGVRLENVSDDYAQIAIQGPKSLALLSSVTDLQLQALKYYHFVEGKILGIPALISRTGYTGELGYEICFPSHSASQIWEKLLDIGKKHDVKPCGLGARDTLRLEMGYLLYGNDMDENTTALECGLSWITKFAKPHFLGKEALVKQKEQGLTRQLVGFEMIDRGVARKGYGVFAENGMSGPEQIGWVTSGSPSPTLGKNIGLALINLPFCKTGHQVFIDIRGEKKYAEIVKKPFFLHGTARNLTTSSY